MKSDIEIAKSIQMRPIVEIASMMGIPDSDIEQYGHYIAKIAICPKPKVKDPKLILVTAITATKAGIGKTTVSVGLALGLNKIGKSAVVALREPSLGPCFGMKGGAAGGGYAQVLPMEKINLHFTGDFHAITCAHNMISAMLDNWIYRHQEDGQGLKEVLWKRVLDVNDRSLRIIKTGLGPSTNGVERESGFDITPASEIMAILCLSEDLEDLRRRVGNIVLGYDYSGAKFTVDDLGITGSIVALLVDAIKPNLVQTTEGTPAIIHGGPFANIAHGCNSVIATKTAMACAEYTITEAGFGADLGAEKFYDIKCRKSGLNPSLTVLVVSLNGLKMHGGTPIDKIKEADQEGLCRGFANMDRHIDNIKSFGQSVLVCINRFPSDQQYEIDLLVEHCKVIGVPYAENNAFSEGGEGAVELANLVVECAEQNPSKELKFAYPDNAPLKEKFTAIATKIYKAKGVHFSEEAERKLQEAEKQGFAHFPICIAKTQFSFSQDPKAYGAPKGFDFEIKDIVVNAGSEMVVGIAGSIIRMPGLPSNPMARIIDVVDGEIVGLS